MDKRRGQVSIFILFSFVILIIAGFLFYLNHQVEEIKQEVKIQSASSDLSTPIKSYVDLCLKSTGESALYFTGLQGGFFNEPSHKIDSKGIFYNFFHAVYLFNGENVMPSLQTIENEISNYIDENLDSCIDDFKDFNNLGYKITRSGFSTATSINEDTVAFSLNFPIAVEKGQKSSTMEDFLVVIPSRLSLVYSLAENITDDQLTHLGSICISCLIELGDANNLYFELIPKTANVTIIAVEDNQTKLSNKPYVFVFAIDHNVNAA
ncbi:hypothetical protein HYU50_02065 [Candidatus Woesearchaeota archaeon]|nr:hypothetical protein [Candidatus Woesearchaeota archaeon]